MKGNIANAIYHKKGRYIQPFREMINRCVIESIVHCTAHIELFKFPEKSIVDLHIRQEAHFFFHDQCRIIAVRQQGQLLHDAQLPIVQHTVGGIIGFHHLLCLVLLKIQQETRQKECCHQCQHRRQDPKPFCFFHSDSPPNTNDTQVPFPISLSKARFVPCSSAICRHRASPKPAPPSALARDLSTI